MTGKTRAVKDDGRTRITIRALSFCPSYFPVKK